METTIMGFWVWELGVKGLSQKRRLSFMSGFGSFYVGLGTLFVTRGSFCNSIQKVVVKIPIPKEQTGCLTKTQCNQCRVDIEP